MEGTYRRQATIEREKFAEIKLEYEERAKRVAWFDDRDAHKGMRERGRLLHSLSQLTVAKPTREVGVDPGQGFDQLLGEPPESHLTHLLVISTSPVSIGQSLLVGE